MSHGQRRRNVGPQMAFLPTEPERGWGWGTGIIEIYGEGEDRRGSVLYSVCLPCLVLLSMEGEGGPRTDGKEQDDLKVGFRDHLGMATKTQEREWTCPRSHIEKANGSLCPSCSI